MFVADGKKENVPTSRISDKATDDETKVHSQVIVSIASWEPQLLIMKEVLFMKTLKLEVLLVKRGKKTNTRT